MFCPYCSTSNDIGQDHCIRCKTKLSITCECCGSITVAGKGFKYCIECGSELPKYKKPLSQKAKACLKYQEYIKSIKDFINSHDGWVSYQTIANYLGFSSCYDKINEEDDKSTVGQLIYLADLKSQGYEIRVYIFTPLNTQLPQHAYRIRFIKKVSDPEYVIEEKIVLEELSKAYKSINFKEIKHFELSIQ